MDVQAFDGFNGTKSDGSPFRVMVVDDSAFMLNQMKRFMEAIGCQVVGTAQDGLEAVKLYPQIKPDVVTMDITMPRMDGIEALTSIKEMDPKAKVIMVSALGHEQMVKDAILKGATYFIVKPLTLSKVRQTMIPVLKKIG
jgi:two-component system chemotaxis response regulator CheY